MKTIRRFINLLMDSDRDLRERQFLMLTTIIQIAVFIILIIDILLGENIVEIEISFRDVIGSFCHLHGLNPHSDLYRVP